MNTKVCIRCHVEKPIEDFPYKSLIRGTRQTVCKTCTRENSSRWYYENKEHHVENVQNRRKKLRVEAREYVLNYLSTHPCEMCGENDPVVLEFHHTGDKEESVSKLVYRADSILMVIREISKCQVLCSNCHRRLTAKERGWFRSKSG